MACSFLMNFTEFLFGRLVFVCLLFSVCLGFFFFVESLCFLLTTFLLCGNFIIPCKVRSCLLEHLSCKMQDAQLQLMKAICPFQKYPSKQSYAEDTVDHWNNIFLTVHHYIV